MRNVYNTHLKGPESKETLKLTDKNNTMIGRPQAAHYSRGTECCSKTLGPKGQGQLADRWEQEPYFVFKQPDPELSVYVIKRV